MAHQVILMVDGVSLSRSRTCERCGATVSLDQVKFYPKGIDGKILLCEKCSHQRESAMKDSLGYRSKMGQSSSITERVPVTSKIIPSEKPASQRTKIFLKAAAQQPKPKADINAKSPYFCTRCNYKFPVDEYNIPRNGYVQCPYCGKSDKTKKL
jgi:DNA-directed RNA polymerase subunit RPC12/RpoP